uniref:Uncharacterized protein n=1 Tax=Salmonella phage vB_Si_CECAV_FGS009 TaxID=3126494 RepID=A0AAU6PY08_9CAUD
MSKSGLAAILKDLCDIAKQQRSVKVEVATPLQYLQLIC